MMTAPQRAALVALTLFFVAGSIGYYRLRYAESKRLRIVDPGKLYRSGQLSSRGLKRAILSFNIRTVINLQEEAPNPQLGNESEASLCRRLGVRYIYLYVDSLSLERHYAGLTPEAARIFLDLVTDPNYQPVLIHCRAGLHRTGILTALYRIHVQNWHADTAWAELRLHGYGEDRCSGRSYTFRDYMLPAFSGSLFPCGRAMLRKNTANSSLVRRPATVPDHDCFDSK
ncbi:MAG: tyrosine-protein phosphatase [Gemmatales bacterium]|nr:tyrosine-protein phosphatase [Gemmatales bacterium]MDW7994251.1 tyrosine-protein phosphatase [Gemmatales bacterium]